MRAVHGARARHGTREGACAPLRFVRRFARADGTAVAFTRSFGDRLGARRSEHGLRRDATATEDESVIGRIVSAQRGELEREIGELKVEADRIAGEARELVGAVPF